MKSLLVRCSARAAIGNSMQSALAFSLNRITGKTELLRKVKKIGSTSPDTDRDRTLT